MRTLETCAYFLVLSLSGCATQKEVDRVLADNAQLRAEVARLSEKVEETATADHIRNARTNDRIDYTQVQITIDKIIPQTIPIMAKLAQEKSMGNEIPAELNWKFGLDNGRLVSMLVSFDGENFEIKNLSVTAEDGRASTPSPQLQSLPERISDKLNDIFDELLHNMKAKRKPQNLLPLHQA